MTYVIRLAFGLLTGREHGIWDARGRPISAELSAGAPVLVGPADGDGRAAAGELARLVAQGGEAAAGAGVELRPGFVSARLAGARGDRRDAVLAALRVVTPDRLGERAGILVSLFGLNATKPVGAAASQAIAGSRWAALDLASAASDLLAPEQLERILALDGLQPGTAPPSAVAGNLAKVLQPIPKRRRLDLLLDLWTRVATQQAKADRATRLRPSRDRLEDVRERYARHQEELILAQLRGAVGNDPTLAQAAMWTPSAWHWTQTLQRAMADALCATVLLRTAIAVAEEGTRQGLDRSAVQLKAAAELLHDNEAGWAARRVPGLAGVPARPGCYVRELARRLGDTTETQAAQRLARAKDYGIVVLESVGELFYTAREHLRPWADSSMSDWRAQVGYTAARPPGEWRQAPPGDGESLAARPAGSETAGDLLWIGELADALAQVHGHDAAQVEYGWPTPHADYELLDQDPLTPRYDEIPLAVAGTAQLTSFGGQTPTSARTWAELVDGLTATAELSEAMTGTFRLPGPLAEVDGRTIPGTDLRVECARNARLLAEWSSYMGNCIAGDYYADNAAKGVIGLLALREPDGRIVANLELKQGRRGWRIEEFQARFNADPEPPLREKVTAWVAGLRHAVPEELPADEPAPPATRGRPRERLFRELVEPLARLAGDAMAEAETVAALRTLESVNNLTALRRMPRDRLARAFDAVRLAELWAATGVRPLEAAITRLDQRERLTPLLADTPLPGSMRRLARHPSIAPARSMELVARRIRAGLVKNADLESADTEALCAFVIAASARGEGAPITKPAEVTVPGYPASDLSDAAGPWQRALPGAVELGADLDAFWAQIANGGLLVPDPRGWQALWSRAARQGRRKVWR